MAIHVIDISNGTCCEDRGSKNLTWISFLMVALDGIE